MGFEPTTTLSKKKSEALTQYTMSADWFEHIDFKFEYFRKNLDF